MLYRLLEYWKMIFHILFSRGHKVLLMHQATNPNLGDQAQRMCTLDWIKVNYPKSKCIEIGDFGPSLSLRYDKWSILTILACYIKILCLKLKVKETDIFIGHSGYFMIDHHSGWKMFVNMMHYFPRNKMLILPQTVNFYTPYIKKFVSKCFSDDRNVILLCRDEVSYRNAQMMFPKTKLLLFPDIVTSLIGTRHFAGSREGILFCMRDDVEAFYKPEEIDALMERFGDIRKEKVDTTLHGISEKDVNLQRSKLIWKMVEKIATYKVVITDRYHGTIFSAIASTPVIVINSADHKLSSGVSWFPKEVFGDYIQFAEDLEGAYDKAKKMLTRVEEKYNNPSYFKEKYWDKLKSVIDERI